MILIRNDGMAFYHEARESTLGLIAASWVERRLATTISPLVQPKLVGTPYQDVSDTLESDVAMCLWEAFLDDRDLFKKYLHNNGTASARYEINSLRFFAEAVWQHVADDYEECFDWDFCPMFLRTFINPVTLAPLHDIPTVIGLVKNQLTPVPA